MALEKECDIFLFKISELQEHDGGYRHSGAPSIILHEQKSIKENNVIVSNWGTIECILIVDEYITKHSDDIHKCSSYKITAKGIVFLSNGGYTNVKEQQDKNDLMFKINISNGKIQSSLLTINRWIAFATVVSGIYNLFALFDFYENHNLNIQNFEYFSTGLVAGIGIGMLIIYLIKVLLKTKNKK